jgi:hypothetical protein
VTELEFALLLFGAGIGAYLLLIAQVALGIWDDRRTRTTNPAATAAKGE